MDLSLSDTKVQRSFIIPAIDIIDGQCVRLSQGDFKSKKIYSSNPVDVALGFQELGCTRLHVVDLDGARSGKVVNLGVLEKIASKTNFIIDFGGGIKTDEDLLSVFDAGAQMAVAGSIAVTRPELFAQWLLRYGGDKLLLGVDVRGINVAINGWKDDTELSIFELLERFVDHGLTQYFCTDISKDGMMSGPAIDLYIQLRQKFPGLRLTASGGVTTIGNILELNNIGCSGAIVGKALYEGSVTPQQILNITGYAG